MVGCSELRAILILAAHNRSLALMSDQNGLESMAMLPLGPCVKVGAKLTTSPLCRKPGIQSFSFSKFEFLCGSSLEHSMVKVIQAALNLLS